MQKKNKGFTLIEMIVTLIIISLVLTFSIAGLLAWQDWSNFNRENEYAQILYVAAQNQLTEYGADGRLKDLQDSLSGKTIDDRTGKKYTEFGLNLTDNISYLKNAEGKSYSLSDIYPESQGKKTQSLYQDEIVSLRAKAGEYDQYLKDPVRYKTVNPESYWVFELLGAYVYDSSILSGSKSADGSGNGATVCVEFSPESGQVFSVLYSDFHDSFIYQNVPGEKGSLQEGVSDICDRSEDYRKEQMIGYYGVDTLSKATSNTLIHPSLSSVKLYNKETFYLTCRLSAEYRSVLTSQLTYVMDLNPTKNVNDKSLTIELPGNKLKNETYADVILCPVSRYDADGNEEKLGEFPVLAWVEPDYTVHVVLDAADLQATIDLYDSELEDIRNAEKAKDTKFSKTMSFFRFGVEMHDFYASVHTSGEGVSESKIVSNFGNLNLFKNQEAKHPIFAGEKTTKIGEATEYTYSLNNGRHLYNVRYLEGLSYEKQAGSVAGAQAIAGEYFIVKSDINWAEFRKNGNVFNSAANHIVLSSLNGKILDEDGNLIPTVTRENCDFPSIPRIRERDCFDGNQKKITGIHVSEVSNVLYGAYTSRMTGSNTLFETRPVGFININYGTVKNLKLDSLVASGANHVGGFIGINAGDASQLELLNTDHKSLVMGKKHVGGIIGSQLMTKQQNTIQNLVNCAKVEGVNAVGGILGMIRNEFTLDDVDLSELTGLSQAQKDLLRNPAGMQITISDCENYGEVAGVNTSQLRGIYSKTSGKAAAAESPEEARYIGGIAGYCYNQTTVPENIMITNCTSAPQFETTALTAILASEEERNNRLKGVYVGGIVGYNYYGQIVKCQTTASKNTQGCLFGYRYVGGIVGLNIGPASGIVGTGLLRSAGENNNHVVAYEYAGGITGCNASVQDIDSEKNDISAAGAKDPEKLVGLLLPDETTSLNVKIDNWVNKGIVIAVNRYAGGITGYNAGYIYRCNSDVKANVANECFGSLYSGNYAGGIAGYNNGIIGNTERKILDGGMQSQIISTGKRFSVVCYVKGHHYVGGIVGYNDVDAIVEDYEIASGYVLGDEGSCFVGGYAGLNASVDLLMHMDQKVDGSQNLYAARYIHSNPNRVKGSYFVGGNIGGNLINLQDTKNTEQGAKKIDRVNGVFLTDNFLGILEGKAFVGGFMGYNILFDNAKETSWIKNDAEKERGGAYILQRNLVEAFEQSDTKAGLSEEQKLVEKKEILDDINKSLSLSITPTTKKVLLSGQGAESTKVSFGSISGAIYVGGVLGYNDENTNLYIQNVENATPIEGTFSIAYEKEQLLPDVTTGELLPRKTDYAGLETEYRYSYAGGILGKVSKNTTLDNCWNSPTGTVTTKGTYTGGLCEINEGMIKNCHLSNFGISVQDYVGGLSGLNKAEIKDCSFQNKTVSGRNMVGGITAENFGTISNISLVQSKLIVEGKVQENGDKHGVCGIFAAYNGNGGIIYLERDIEGVSVTSSGRYVGMVAGINEGIVENQKTGTGDTTNENNLVLSGQVKGDKTVGALFGLNKNPNEAAIVAHYTNQASVTAVNGYAGGIIGENESGNKIRYCVNDGIVSAPDSGIAGGITSLNNSQIIDCINYQSVNAPEDMCGGITAINYKNGMIRNCQVRTSDAGKEIVFRSNETVGGISAENYGLISGNFISNVVITNETTDTGTELGVLVGDNKETGEIYFADSSLKQEGTENCKVIVKSNYSKAGGVAGTNAGLIIGVADKNSGLPASVIQCSITMENATVASLGGVAGWNTGQIQNLAVDAVMKGELGSATTGYGGIAGGNGWEKETDIPDVQEENGKKTARILDCTFDGSINAQGSSGAPVRVGGITGINGYGAVIEKCYIGVRASETVDSPDNITYVSAGDITKTAESKDTTDTQSYSNLGGIAGDNYGRIAACDNARYSVDKVQIIGFAGETGGIVGYNYPYAFVSGYYDEAAKKEYYLSTGKNWSVEQRCCGNDRGPGGIIGKSESAEPFRYVTNYASVVCDYKSNNYVGGLIGVLGQRYELVTEFYQCENYGTIRSYRDAGGFIGMLEGMGADFTECRNYGDVTCDTKYCAGFISLQYAFSVGTNFTKCENHGNITATGGIGDIYVGGFIGRQDQSKSNSTIETYLYDCVNTGAITKGNINQKDTKCGAFIGGTNTALTFELCRNYNNQESTYGFCNTNGYPKYKNCFDNSGIVTNAETNPFSNNSSWNSNMLYLNRNSNRIFNHKDYGVYFSYHPGLNANFNLNTLYYSYYLPDPSYLFVEPGISNRFTFRDGNNPYRQINCNLSYSAESQGIDSVVLYFWNGSNNPESGSNRNYKCQATYYYTDENGQVTTQTTEEMSAIGCYGLEEQSRVELKNPSSDKKPTMVSIRFLSGTNLSDVNLRGICYIPAEEAKETVCRYFGEQTGTTFRIESMEKIGSSGEVLGTANWSSTLPKNEDNNKNKASIVIPNDVMDINWEPYTNFRLSPGNGNTAKITVSVKNEENAPGMDAFVFYLTNNNTSSSTAPTNIRTYYYDYSVTFSDSEGNTVTTDVSGAKGYDAGKEDYMALSRQEVQVPTGLNSAVTKITLSIKSVKFSYIDSRGTYKEGYDSTVYFRGFRWIPKGGGQEQRMAAYNPEPIDTLHDTLRNNSKKTILLGLEISDGKQYVYDPLNYEYGFYMENNPISETYYQDHESYQDSKTESGKSGSRIDTYLELDPKIMDLMLRQCLSEEKLEPPQNLKKTENAGYITYTWKQMIHTYGYEIKYIIYDTSGKEVFASDIIKTGAMRDSYRIPMDSSWNEKGYHISFYIRGINAYHYMHEDENSPEYDKNYEKYDSDWVSLGGENGDEMKKVLPTPVIHMEAVAGNRMTFVLDNYQDYVDGGCTDCTLKVTYKNIDYSWNVLDGKYREPVYVIGQEGSPTDFQCYATPNESLKDSYTDSAYLFQRGEGVGNDKLPTKDKYCDTYFRGFFGEEADSMEYHIAFKLTNLDTYLMTDILAYDEEVGATVVYDNEITHAANSYSNGGQLILTSTLNNLPQEWFGEENVPKVTARAYPYRSQYEIIHYGHSVAEGIVLDGTAEENRKILSTIYDELYFPENGTSQVSNCVFDTDKNDIKSGYLLQRQDDGTYNIYYSAVVEMSEAAAAEKRAEGDKYREYYNYVLSYRIYSDFASETQGEALVNSKDFMESYWSRALSDGSNYNTTILNNNERKNIQEIHSVPIVQDKIVKGVDENGDTTYRISWDTYYQDVYCLKNNTFYPDNNINYLTDAEGLFATWDAYLEKFQHAGLANTDSFAKDWNSRNNMKNLMNVYYNNYSEASYRVDLIGTTMDGKEFILDTALVDEPTEKGSMTGIVAEDGSETPLTTMGGKTTTYKVWDYECLFTDTKNVWDSYPRLTMRIMRLGQNSTIKLADNKYIYDSNKAAYILPRYVEKSIELKLNMNTISKPEVTLLKENGQFITSDLVYEVKWGGITDTRQKQDLGGYMITAKVVSGNQAENAAKTHYYYVTDLPENVEDTIDLNLTALEAKGVVTDVTKDYQRTDSSCSTRINLSDFNTDDLVEISVQAIARMNSEQYTDSEEGVPNEILIPTRLQVPDVSNLTCKLQSDLENGNISGLRTIVDKETYQEGIAFTYNAEDYHDISDAEIVMAVAVYSRKPEGAEQDTALVSEDFAAGAEKVIYAKETPCSFGKAGDNNVVNIRMTEFEQYPGEYAGKWMQIAMQAVCETKIDSQWTDQDKDGQSINYAWIQIPALQLPDISLTELGTTEEGDIVRYALDGKIYNASVDKNFETQLASKSLQFAEEKNVDGYAITIKTLVEVPAGSVSGNGGVSGNETPGGVSGNGAVSGNETPGGMSGNGAVSGNETPGNVSGNGAVSGNKMPESESGNGAVNGNETPGNVSGNGAVNGNETPGNVSGNGAVSGNKTPESESGNGAVSGNKTLSTGEAEESEIRNAAECENEAAIRTDSNESTLEGALELTAEDISKYVLNGTSAEKEISDVISEETINETSSGIPEETINETSNGIPEETINETSNGISEETINETLEEISEEMIQEESEEVSEEILSVNSEDILEEALETKIPEDSLEEEPEKQLTENAENSPSQPVYREVIYTLYLQRHLSDESNADSYDGTWDVYLFTEEVGILPEKPEQKPECEQNANAVWIGRCGKLFTLDGADTSDLAQLIEIPYIHKEYAVDDETYDLQAQLRYAESDTEGSFLLVLPDLTKVGEMPYEGSAVCTESVTVKYHVKSQRPYLAGQEAVYKKEEQE